MKKTFQVIVVFLFLLLNLSFFKTNYTNAYSILNTVNLDNADNEKLIKVDPSVQFQEFDGFGIAISGWANAVGTFEYKYLKRIAKRLFDTNEGLGLNVVRYGIGTGFYTDLNKRKMLIEAKNNGVNIFEAFYENPPRWIIGQKNTNLKKIHIKKERYKGFADYLVKRLKIYKDYYGITFDTLSPIYQPSYIKNDNVRDNSNLYKYFFSKKQQEKILLEVFKSIKANGLETKISSPDEKSVDLTFSSFSSYNQKVKDCIYQIDTQTYDGLNKVRLQNLAQSNCKNLWVSEYCDNDETGLSMALKIIDDIKKLRPKSWIYKCALDAEKGKGFFDTPLSNNSTDFCYKINKKYYAMCNFSKFIRPKNTFIAIDDSYSLACIDKKNKKVIIVTVNSDMKDKNVTYDLSKFKNLGYRVLAYRTSLDESFKKIDNISTSDKKLNVSLKAKSINTYVLDGEYKGDLSFNPNKYYKIMNNSNGLYMSCYSMKEGSNLILCPKNKKRLSYTNEEFEYLNNENLNLDAYKKEHNIKNNEHICQWQIIGIGNGYFKLINRCSGLAAEVHGGYWLPNIDIIQNRNAFEKGSQQWKIIHKGYGNFIFINKRSQLSMDIKNILKDKNDEKKLIQSNYNRGKKSQLWSIIN